MHGQFFETRLCRRAFIHSEVLRRPDASEERSHLLMEGCGNKAKMEKIRVKAYAKINLALDVLGKREDGYHELEMVMQSISLHDELYFFPARILSLKTNERRLPTDGRNLIIRAAEKLIEYTGRRKGARIILHKNIPVGAGLGGGSADAAAALVGLNRLWDLNLPITTLSKLAATLGADVPFFLTGGTVLARGIGERLTPLPPLSSRSVFLAKPPFTVSTALVYKKLDLTPEDRHPEMEKVLSILEQGEFLPITKYWGNILEKVTLRLYPEIQEVMDWLTGLGFPVRMTGSGPTLFLFRPTPDRCFTAIDAKLRDRGWWTYEGTFVDKGLVIAD
ncbi:MAG: 4-(cytidine 5'-diphospho)-2-C-methyl-D-erythritol kinase [Firmicutes bacterium]|nr:4-(cytidine 5'-diphospho)-2-C-methyl-D-erythritol kinase [Bacillota bacterium]